MQKIPTLFKRNWDTGRITNSRIVSEESLEGAVATEKLDGTNVRVTIRNGVPVRLEKRRNPTKPQKGLGIIDPWYVDANPNAPEDKHIFESVDNTDMSSIPDGEWSAEALGPKIQGNPLGLDTHILIFFSVPEVRQRMEIDVSSLEFQSLRELLPTLRSSISPTKRVEGLVWWSPRGEPVAKIKLKDFRK